MAHARQIMAISGIFEVKFNANNSIPSGALMLMQSKRIKYVGKFRRQAAWARSKMFRSTKPPNSKQ